MQWNNKLKPKSDFFDGKYVSDYIKELTSDPEMVVNSWLNKYVKNNNWELKTIPISVIRKDPAFEEQWKAIEEGNDELRYDEEAEGLNSSHLRQPVVLFQDDNEVLLIDGYSRTIRHLVNGENNIQAYVNVRNKK